MNYVGWNSKIGEFFFGEGSGGRRVVMCVTRDKLSEISGLPPDVAPQNFVSAVLEGPDWNRIRGLRFLRQKFIAASTWIRSGVSSPGATTGLAAASAR